MPKKICIFPSDPHQAYFYKGEIKERYYNPENTFDEIHIRKKLAWLVVNTWCTIYVNYSVSLIHFGK